MVLLCLGLFFEPIETHRSGSGPAAIAESRVILKPTRTYHNLHSQCASIQLFVCSNLLAHSCKKNLHMIGVICGDLAFRWFLPSSVPRSLLSSKYLHLFMSQSCLLLGKLGAAVFIYSHKALRSMYKKQAIFATNGSVHCINLIMVCYGPYYV